MRLPLLTTCPRCHAAVRIRLGPGQVCPQCEAVHAWQHFQEPGRKLVVDAAAIEAAEAHRLGGYTERRLAWRGLLALPSAVAVALGASALMMMLVLLRAKPIGPVEPFLTELGRQARWTTLLGVAAFLIGLGSLIVLRRMGRFRAWVLSTSAGFAIVIGCVAMIVGGPQWRMAGAGFGWNHRSVPALDMGEHATLAWSIMEATAVIVAPDSDGDMRGMSIGAGAVVRSSTEGQWAVIVTCSHVAMPFSAKGTLRDASVSPPVWVYLKDGRDVEGRVVWTAQPPMDLALVEIQVDSPPRAVEVSPDANTVDRGDAVAFVPNPLRSGWMIHVGSVKSRRPHLTREGEYELLFTDLPLQGGDSGTGLFDGQGRLIGINTWASNHPEESMGISLPSEALQTIAELAERDESKLQTTTEFRGKTR